MSNATLPEIPPAQEVTKSARSNLAFAFAALPRARRKDAVTFYAFCRWVDDLADDEALPLEKRRALLERWHQGAIHSFQKLPQARPLEQELEQVITRHGIKREHLASIVEGMQEDLDPKRFATIKELEAYNYKVASCVGLVSVRIFGAHHAESEQYAYSLGQALQWTNILRDVGEDLRERQRIYLPTQELNRFLLSDRDLAAQQTDERFQALMTHLSNHAKTHYQAAKSHLSSKDKSALKAAEGMRRIYLSLLNKMQADQFQVFQKRYRLSKWEKLYELFLGKS